MLASVTCVLIYSLRRHRIDDFKGRYRVWMAAAAACALLSVESVAPLPSDVGRGVGLLYGLDGAAWSCGVVARAGGAAAGLGRVAGLARCAGEPVGGRRSWGRLVAYGVALASYLGIGLEVAPQSEVMITAGAALVGHWLMLVGVVSYGRFVVLDAQGLIPVRVRNVKQASGSKQKNSVKDREVKNVASRSTAAAASTSPLRSFRESLQSSASDESQETEWVDGTEPVSENYDDEDGDFGDRKMSKSERKRLRKQKRAA